MSENLFNIIIIIYGVLMIGFMAVFTWSIIDLKNKKKKFFKAIEDIENDLMDEVMGFDGIMQIAIKEIIKRATKFI